MLKETTAVILAGGRGERMGSLTQFQQKCMLPVNGVPIMEYILDNIQQAFGSAKLIIATGWHPESITDYFGNKYRNIEIEYVHSPERLETRKRLLLTEDLIKGQFLYLAGDVISNPELLSRVATSFEREKSDGMMGVISAATDHQPALSHALITAKDKHAIEMVYPPTAIWNEQQVREMGIAFFDRSFLYRLKQARPEQTYLSHIISESIGQGTDFVVEKYFQKWYHFLRPEDINTAIKFKS